MTSLLDELNRAWKFSVLFRLGYPMRVLMDDHMRIGAAFGFGGAGAFVSVRGPNRGYRVMDFEAMGLS